MNMKKMNMKNMRMTKVSIRSTAGRLGIVFTRAARTPETICQPAKASVAAEARANKILPTSPSLL